MKTVNFRKFIFISIILLALGSGLFWLGEKYNFFRTKSGEPTISDSPTAFVSFSPSVTPTRAPIISVHPSPSPTLRPSPTSLAGVLLEVPFFAQAPFGEWADQIFQDVC